MKKYDAELSAFLFPHDTKFHIHVQLIREYKTVNLVLAKIKSCYVNGDPYIRNRQKNTKGS